MGFTEGEFMKGRYNQKSLFKIEDPRKSTSLHIPVWKIKDKNKMKKDPILTEKNV